MSESTETVVERRTCPCTHIVALAEKTSGDIKLIQQDLANTRGALEDRSRASLEDIEAMRIGIKECLESMQKSALMFSEGNHRFQRIDGEVIALKNEMISSKLEAKEQSIEKVRAWQEEEAKYRAGVAGQFDAHRRAWLAITSVIIIFHGQEVVRLFERFVFR